MSEQNNTTHVLEYLQKHFPDGRLSGDSTEYTMNSLFTDDIKKHMSVNTFTGLWQCFKTGEKGNFAKLISAAEGISYGKANARIAYEEYTTSASKSFVDVSEILEDRMAEEVKNFEPITKSSNTNDPLIQKALLFLYNRGLFPEEDNQFFVCREGKYATRLIIPYIESNEWVYFQARALNPFQVPKYLNPGRSSGVMARNVILPFDMWGTSNVYVTEGPLDALTLRRNGYNATCTNGSNPSRAQVEMIYDDPRSSELRSFMGATVIVAYDNDAAGREGIEKFDKIRKELRLPPFYIATPDNHKDWNDLHINVDTDAFQAIADRTTPYSDFYKMEQKIKNYLKPL